MIRGKFDMNGRPLLWGRLHFNRLNVGGNIEFLVDTGASHTCLHPQDGMRLKVPYHRLRNPIYASGIGGDSKYYREPAVLFFTDGQLLRAYSVLILVADPTEHNDDLSSLLGQSMLQNWNVHHYRPSGRLSFGAKFATETFRASMGDLDHVL